MRLKVELWIANCEKMEFEIHRQARISANDLETELNATSANPEIQTGIETTDGGIAAWNTTLCEAAKITPCGEIKTQATPPAESKTVVDGIYQHKCDCGTTVILTQQTDGCVLGSCAQCGRRWSKWPTEDPS